MAGFTYQSRKKISEKWDKDYLDMELDDNYWLDD